MALTPLDTGTGALFAISLAGLLQSEKKKLKSAENALIEGRPARSDYAPRLMLNL